MSIVRRNACIIVPLALLQSSAYWLLNHYPIRLPSSLPLTALDEAIPFLRWTVWPYLLLMVAGPILALFISSRAVMRRVLIAYAFSIPPAFLVFLLFPTHYPRPFIEIDPSLTGLVYSWLIKVDSPLCAFPSGHILVPALVVSGAWLDRWPMRWLLLLGFMVIAPTILTTKQHYAWDPHRRTGLRPDRHSCLDDGGLQYCWII